MLEAQGYPDKKGALSSVSAHLNVPLSTLRGWYSTQHNPPPTEIRDEKKGDLVALIKTELEAAFSELPNARSGAGYKDIGTVIGILVDKLQLLEGNPTERTEIVDGNSARERIRGAITRLAERSGKEPDNQFPQ
jgi:hypothetical protein